MSVWASLLGWLGLADEPRRTTSPRGAPRRAAAGAQTVEARETTPEVAETAEGSAEPAAAGGALPNGTASELDAASEFFSLIGFPERSVAPPSMGEAAEEEALVDEVLARTRLGVKDASPPPAASLKILDSLSNPDLSVAELTRTVSLDPSMCSALLRVANSPAYAAAQEILSVRDAITRVGNVEVARIASAVAARSMFAAEGSDGLARFAPKLSDIFVDAVTTARGAAYLALQARGGRSDLAFLGGILVDLGRSAALRALAEVAQALPPDALGAERVDRIVEQVHVALGSELHEAMSLPSFAVLAARRHHDSVLPCDGQLVEVHRIRLVATLVHLRAQPWRETLARVELNDSAGALSLDARALRALDTHLRSDRVVVEERFGGAGGGRSSASGGDAATTRAPAT